MAEATELIAEQVVSGTSTNQITFSSIPQTYDDLKFIMQYMSTGTSSSWEYDYLTTNFNGDTTNAYYQQGFMRIKGNNDPKPNMQTSLQSRVSYDSIGTSYNGQSNPGICEFNIPRYSDSGRMKEGTARFAWLSSIDSDWNNGYSLTAPIAFWVYTPTGPITQVSFKGLSANWKAGSKFSLYGISNS